MSLELGIDEAGRGAILGPLVMAGALVEEKHQKNLLDWGVADSKKFGGKKNGKKRRSMLASKISNYLRHQIIVIQPQTVDYFVNNFSINVLEQQMALKIIQSLSADRVMLDGKSLFAPILNHYVHAEDKADQRYLSVAAASILAKDKRDQLFESLCQPFEDGFGEIKGGGYANSQTLEFVKWHKATKGELPGFYRRSYSWKALV